MESLQISQHGKSFSSSQPSRKQVMRKDMSRNPVYLDRNRTLMFGNHISSLPGRISQSERVFNDFCNGKSLTARCWSCRDHMVVNSREEKKNRWFRIEEEDFTGKEL